MSIVGPACFGGNAPRLARGRADYLGITYASESQLLETPNGQVVLVSFSAPEAKVPLAVEAFRTWVKAISGGQ